MRILYVYDGDWPRGAIRVAKQTRSLAAAGHTVHLISRNSQGQPRRQQEPWMTVLRLPHFRPRWVGRALNFPFFFNPVWIWSIWRAAKEMGAECMVASDLPLALTALWVGRWLRIPVHYDMAEVYPEFLRSLWACEDMSWSDHFVRNPRAADWIERRVLPRFRTIFVVSEESRARCLQFGVPADRLVIVGNTPENVETLGACPPMPADLAPWKRRPRVLFVGTLIGDRGVAAAVEAMTHVISDVPDAALIVVGDGPDRSRIQAAIDRAGVRDHVALLGWRESPGLAAYYHHADVGLLPFQDTPHIRITLANKLFDYMAAGLPVVAVDVPPMRRIVHETGAGVLYPPGDTAALARAIVELLRDPPSRATFGTRGRQAATTKYCWREDEKRLVAAVVRGQQGAEDDIGRATSARRGDVGVG
jgi:glycosyltransferase involved in cell wall biosynthesis